MNANKKAKVEEVKVIEAKIKNANSLVVVDYTGLTVKQFQTLRKDMKAKKVELIVYKNRLFKIAAQNLKLDALSDSLVGQNAFAFGSEDDIAPAKILAKFAKEHEVLKLKAGIFEGKVVFEEELHKVATLPSYEEALSMLAMQLISPVKFIGVGLHQLVEEGKITA